MPLWKHQCCRIELLRPMRSRLFLPRLDDINRILKTADRGAMVRPESLHTESAHIRTLIGKPSMAGDEYSALATHLRMSRKRLLEIRRDAAGGTHVQDGGVIDTEPYRPWRQYTVLPSAIQYGGDPF